MNKAFPTELGNDTWTIKNQKSFKKLNIICHSYQSNLSLSCVNMITKKKKGMLSISPSLRPGCIFEFSTNTASVSCAFFFFWSYFGCLVTKWNMDNSYIKPMSCFLNCIMNMILQKKGRTILFSNKHPYLFIYMTILKAYLIKTNILIVKRSIKLL